ncbi:MAG TPA: macro domain-containing protein [Candidatus Binataceae bacterium]|nr:macro domain-containing protein [Candidatus Binataceae bacterium]
MANDWRERLTLRQGDITQAEADAIVNAANNDLILGAGVAGAIRSKGGPSIQRECDKIGPIAIGEAAITGGGELPARYVIHAASMRLGERTTAGALRAATRNSLLRADENNLRTIAFPAIGTGIAGFPLDECARIMLEEIRDHLLGATKLEHVEIVLFDAAALSAFEQVLAAFDN